MLAAIWLHVTLALSIEVFAASVDAAVRTPRLPLRPVRILVNRARVAELALLPGVGPARAEAIVLARIRDGPIRDVAELARVPGIGPSLATRLGEWVEFGSSTDDSGR